MAAAKRTPKSNGLIYLINGPNLNLLGTREPEIYGNLTLKNIENACAVESQNLGYRLKAVQSNIEGEIIEALHAAARENAIGAVINGAGYTHTSVAIRDAISAIVIPVIEVHISNIHAREEFRHHTYTGAVARGVITGLGLEGYLAALRALAKIHQGAM
jgi:3-dehydroquinate dehydratase-2